MQRATAAIGTTIFFVFAPCVVAGVVPWLISRWKFSFPVPGVQLTRFVGAALIVAGVAGLVDSFARFALQGLGTPAPISPTRHLVATGLYRYVRNPMYVAVVAVIFGQAVLFGDWRLFAYGAVFWLVCHLFVVGYEEPTLTKLFRAEYETFRINVPRWIPRLTAWRGR
jgi:protein-S-isoprenylcysteine O-methyltransferase Ste14